MATVLGVVFWSRAGLLVYAQVGYRCCSRRSRGCAAARAGAAAPSEPPDASRSIVAAYDEEAVIAREGRQRAARSTTRASGSR